MSVQVKFIFSNVDGTDKNKDVCIFSIKKIANYLRHFQKQWGCMLYINIYSRGSPFIIKSQTSLYIIAYESLNILNNCIFMGEWNRSYIPFFPPSSPTFLCVCVCVCVYVCVRVSKVKTINIMCLGYLLYTICSVTISIGKAALSLLVVNETRLHRYLGSSVYLVS